MKTNNNVNANVNPVTEDIQTVNAAVPTSNVTVYDDSSIDTVTVASSNPMLVPGAMVPQEKGVKAFFKRHKSGITTAALFVGANLLSYGAGREST